MCIQSVLYMDIMTLDTGGPLGLKSMWGGFFLGLTSLTMYLPCQLNIFSHYYELSGMYAGEISILI